MLLSYWLAAICLSVIASGFIIGPLVVKSLLEKRKSQVNQSTAENETIQGDLDREHINVGLYEERMAELNAQLEEMEISNDDFAEMQLELQKNLLVDTNELDLDQRAVARVGKLPMVFAVLVPLFAVVAYSEYGFNWGSIGDVEVARELQSEGTHDPATMRQTVEKLARSMEQQPDNHEGWFMLGQLYHGQSEYEKAADVFKRLSLVYVGDSGLASYYAESLFLADGRKITARVDEAIKKALALNPHDLTMLEIRGMDAFQKSEYSAAHRYFTTALSIAKGPRAKLIQQALDRLESQTGVTGTKANAQIAAVQTEEAEVSGEAPAVARSLEVLVEIDSQVDVNSESSVFIFARAITGTKMPLAVQKMKVTDFPQLIKLDESMAMMKGMGLANFDLIEVVARISSSGIANASPDDYEAKSGQIDLTKPGSVVKLIIKNKLRDQ
jgi:cytochrome c-type biogenesis protein CcmH